MDMVDMQNVPHRRSEDPGSTWVDHVRPDMADSFSRAPVSSEKLSLHLF